MGMYRTIGAILPCDGCGKKEEWEVQFKTGDDDLQAYAINERVSDDGVLETGVPYSGCGSRYCGGCLYRLRLVQREILAAFLRLQMNRGRLKVAGSERAKPLSVAEVASIVEALPVYVDLDNGLRVFARNHLVWWDGQVAAAPMGMIHKERAAAAESLKRAWRQRLTAGCRKRGWASCNDFRHYRVVLTSAWRFRVTVSAKPVPTPRVVTEREQKVWGRAFGLIAGRKRKATGGRRKR